MEGKSSSGSDDERLDALEAALDDGSEASVGWFWREAVFPRQRRMMKPKPNEYGAIIGDRVKMVACDDPYTTIDPGTEGEVDFIDDAGTVFVKWDNGLRLGMVHEAGDRIEIVRRHVMRVGTRVRPLFPNDAWGDGTIITVSDDPDNKAYVVQREDGTVGYFDRGQVQALGVPDVGQ